MKFKEFVTVHSSFYARHRWKDAPNEIKFLREKHPHEFKVLVSIEVKDNNREIEYYLLREELDNILETFRGNSYELSCEQFAEKIFDALVKKHGNFVSYRITVNEDQGFGSTLEVEGDEEDE